MKEQLSALDVVIRQSNSAKPQISDVHDLESDDADHLTTSGYLELTGSNICIEGTDTSVGLYFVNTTDDGNTLRLDKEKLSMNTTNLAWRASFPI